MYGEIHRGFESLSLRLRGGAREADWARLLSECWGQNLSRGFESRPPRQRRSCQPVAASFLLLIATWSAAGTGQRVPLLRASHRGCTIRTLPSPPDLQEVGW